MRSPKLVLRSFKVDPQAGTVEISGRPEGIINFLLTLLNLQTTTTFRASRERVDFDSASIFGMAHISVPAAQVSSASYGHGRQWVLLALAAVFGMGAGLFSLITVASSRSDGSGIMALFMFVCFAIAAAAFVLSKTMVLTIETTGGMTCTVRFKSSVIEGVQANLESLNQAAAVLLSNIATRQQPAGALAPTTDPATSSAA